MDDNATNLVWACDGSHDGAEQHAAFLKRIENDGKAVIEWVSTGDITTVPMCQISRELKSRRHSTSVVAATIKKSPPASSSSKVTAAATAVGTWKCHKCNATNPPERKRCEGCLGWKGGVRDLSSTSPKSAKQSAIIDIEQKSDKSSSTLVAAVRTWKCHKCDTTNPPSRSRCEGCLGWKGGVHEAIVGTWKCHKCDTTNPPSRSRCESCLGWKGGVHEAIVGTWKCHKCDTTNPPSRSRCEGCLGWKGGVRDAGYSNSPSESSGTKHAEKKDKMATETLSFDSLGNQTKLEKNADEDEWDEWFQMFNERGGKFCALALYDDHQSAMPNDPPSRSSSTQTNRSSGRPSKSISSSRSLNAAPNHVQLKNYNMLQEENQGVRKRQRNIKYIDFVMDNHEKEMKDNSLKLKSSAGNSQKNDDNPQTDNTVVDRDSSIMDREFAKSVAQDSFRRSIRERSAPELFVARPSKSGVGVRDGDEEFLKSCTTAAAAAKRSGNARGRREHESDGEEEDSLDCSKLNRQKWSAKEDKELIKRVRLHGAGNWKTILDNSPILQERYSNAPSATRARTSIQMRWRYKYMKSGIDDDDDDDPCSSESEDESGEDSTLLAKRKGSCEDKKKAALSSFAVEYLKAWMMSPDHIKHPYPSEDEKLQIMSDTGIELKQLTNWFVNNRKRYWRPKVDEMREISEHPHITLQEVAASSGTPNASSVSMKGYRKSKQDWVPDDRIVALQQNEKSKQSTVAKKKVWVHPEGERVPAAESKQDDTYKFVDSKISNEDDPMDETCHPSPHPAKEAPSDERIPLTSDTFPQWLKQKKEQWHSEREKRRSSKMNEILEIPDNTAPSKPMFDASGNNIQFNNNDVLLSFNDTTYKAIMFAQFKKLGIDRNVEENNITSNGLFQLLKNRGGKFYKNINRTADQCEEVDDTTALGKIKRDIRQRLETSKYWLNPTSAHSLPKKKKRKVGSTQNQSHGYAAKAPNTMSTPRELTAIGPRKRSKPQKFIDVQGQDFALVRNGSCGNSSNGASRLSSSISNRPAGAVIEKPNAKSDIYADEILKRIKKQSVATVAKCVARNEATLEIVRNEICHVCHNRKESGIRFHCGRHSYCDYHTATRLSFWVNDYDKKNPTSLPINYCPVCTLNCTCAKCIRRLGDVSRKMKIECERQNVGVEEVEMDNLYDLCNAKNVRVGLLAPTKPKKADSSSGNTKKRKKSVASAKSDESGKSIIFCHPAKEAPSDERIPLTSDTFPQWLRQKKEQWHSERKNRRLYSVQNINAPIILTENALHEIEMFASNSIGIAIAKASSPPTVMKVRQRYNHMPSKSSTQRSVHIHTYQQSHPVYVGSATDTSEKLGMTFGYQLSEKLREILAGKDREIRQIVAGKYRDIKQIIAVKDEKINALEMKNKRMAEQRRQKAKKNKQMIAMKDEEIKSIINTKNEKLKNSREAVKRSNEKIKTITKKYNEIVVKKEEEIAVLSGELANRNTDILALDKQINHLKAAASDRKYNIGATVSKLFYSAEEEKKYRPFAGVVAAYDYDEKLYLVRYEDGDEEELPEKDLSLILVDEGGRSLKRVHGNHCISSCSEMDTSQVRDKEIAKRGREILKRDKELARRDEQIEYLKKQVASLKEDAKNVKNRDKEVRALERDLARKDEYIASLKADADDRDVIMAEDEAREDEIALLNDELVAKEKEIELLTKALSCARRKPQSDQAQTQHKVVSVQLDYEHINCDICKSEYSTDMKNKDERMRLPVLSSSKSCDHWFCHGCILQQQATLAEHNNANVPKWIPCMVCRTKTAFCPSEPKYHRMLIGLLKQSKWTDPVKEEPQV